jgi:hypothetical protein
MLFLRCPKKNSTFANETGKDHFAVESGVLQYLDPVINKNLVHFHLYAKFSLRQLVKCNAHLSAHLPVVNLFQPVESSFVQQVG